MRWPPFRRRERVLRKLPPADAWEALERCTHLPSGWVAAIALATCLSLIKVAHGATGWTFEVRATTISGVIVALLWLPALLRVIALTGGNLKTPAGEASTTGLLDFFNSLPREQREQSLAAVAATVEEVETRGPEQQRPRAREVREAIETALGDTAQSDADLVRRLEQVATQYAQLREGTPSGAFRTREMTMLVSLARGLVSSGRTRIRAREWFERGGEGARIVALAAIQTLKDPADADVVVEAIARSRSAFEQFHALRAAEELMPYLGEEQLRPLLRAIEGQIAQEEHGGAWITPRDSSRWELAQHLRAKIRLRLAGQPIT